jgi:hypothetical protein
MSHVLIRRYLNNPKLNLVVSGAPREQMYGIARFMTIMFDVSFGQVTKLLSLTLKGPHKGSYFGSSMTSCDLNGDKTDDLIISAPYYSKKNEPNVGAIYIYMNDRLKGFGNSYVLNFTGSVRSLFGHSIACLGDIDKDGYNDFAVGAPYEINSSKNETLKESFSGAVYIFRGNKDPSKIRLVQKIYANSLNVNELKSFGYSLSGGMDMDSNSYPDLAVGSMNSNSVMLLRTRPVIHIKSFIKNNDTIIDIDQKIKQCKSDSNLRENDLTCFKFDICFELTNKNEIGYLNGQLSDLDFLLEAEPNMTGINSRVHFLGTNLKVLQSKIRLNPYDQTCKNVQVYIKKENTDFLRPIKFQVKYKFSNEKSMNLLKPIRLQDIQSNPIVHEDLNEFDFEANFKRDCGPDKICITDLKLNAFFTDLIIGEDKQPVVSFKESDQVTLTVALENNELDSEAAYSTHIDIEFDERLDFIKKTENVSSNIVCILINNTLYIKNIYILF